MKLAIVGSRTIPSLDLTNYIHDLPDVIITGGAKGVDAIAEDFARSHGVELVVFKPDYTAHNRKAPLIRNQRIVEAADEVMAFWDGHSKGTKYSIDWAKRKGKRVHVVLLDE